MPTEGEPPKPPGPYFLWCMAGNRQRISDSLDEGSRSRQEVAKALSAAWKGLPDGEKQKWKDKNAKTKKDFEDYVARGGVVTPGAYAKTKERKARRQGADGAGKRSRKNQSGDASDALSKFSDDDLLDEIRRRLCKRPRLEETDGAAPETEAAESTAENGVPDPADLLQRFGKKVPEEEHAGMEAWMHKRLQKISGELELQAGKPASHKDIWIEAKRTWMQLSQEKKDRWAAA